MEKPFSTFIVFSLLVTFSRPYEIVVDKIEILEGDDGYNIFSFDTLKVKKFNRSAYVLTGDFTIKEDISDGDLTTLSEGFNFNAGQYKKIGDKRLENLCTILNQEKFKDTYLDVKSHSNIPDWGTCPIPAVRAEKEAF